MRATYLINKNSFNQRGNKMKLRLLIFYLILLTWQSQSFCQNANAKKWKEDLQYLSSELKDEHKNLYHTVSEQDFQKAVDALDKKNTRFN